jgi:hypothetical protein
VRYDHRDGSVWTGERVFEDQEYRQERLRRHEKLEREKEER